MKKLLAILMAAALVVSLAACGNKAEDNTTAADDTTVATDDVNAATGTTAEGDTTAEDATVVTEVVTDKDGETVTSKDGEAVTKKIVVTTKKGETTKKDTKTTAAKKTTVSGAKDPSKWSTAEIISAYKAAVAKSGSVKSTQKMTLKSLDGGSGVIGTVINMVKPVAVKALAKNSTSFDGITGHADKIVASDLKSAKAYKSGNYTVIEFAMKDQTDGERGNPNGTVSHVMGTLGSVDDAIKALDGIKVDYSNGSITLKYTDATAKVKINNTTGKIEKGTWSDNVNATLKQVKVSIATLNGTKAVIGYSITVGGGF